MPSAAASNARGVLAGSACTGSGLRPSIAIIARMQEDNVAFHDYYLPPWLVPGMVVSCSTIASSLPILRARVEF